MTSNPSRREGFAVFAAHGLAPFLYEVDADAFMSEDGDVSARIEIEYPILITQRLILQPALELDFARHRTRPEPSRAGVKAPL